MCSPLRGLARTRVRAVLFIAQILRHLHRIRCPTNKLLGVVNLSVHLVLAYSHRPRVLYRDHVIYHVD